jgi:hypothetical protein
MLSHKPTAPQLQIRLKTHKENYPIRPVVNNINAPTYKLASFLNNLLLHLIQLHNTYNVQNSAQLAKDLTTIKIHEHHRCVTGYKRPLYKLTQNRGLESHQTPVAIQQYTRTYNNTMCHTTTEYIGSKLFHI